MDLTTTIVPKSDQLNADDLMAGPVTVTILEVRKGSPEQPVDVIVEEFPGRAYRPSKSMRRVMVLAWGPEASTYSGRRLRLFRNPEITFGRDKVGGIEIAAMSHIDKPLTVALTATRGKRKDFTVQLLTATTTEAGERDHSHWVRLLSGAETLAALQTIWSDANTAGAAKHQDVIDAKDARKAELNA